MKKFWLSLIIAFCVFIVVLVCPFPTEISKFSMNSLIFDGVLFFFLVWICQRKKFRKIDILPIVNFFFFALPLSFFWHAVKTDQSIIGGIIPDSDSFYYYGNALNLLIGKQLDSTVQGRTLFPAFLSFLLKITSGNIQITQLILVFLGALTSYLFLEEIRYHFSSISTAFIMTGIYLFYKTSIPYLMPNQLGLALGFIGSISLLLHIRKPYLKHLLLGIFVLTLSQMARPGAMLLLPLLMIYAIFTLQKEQKNWKNFLLIIGIGVLGFIFNQIFFIMLLPPENLPFSSALYILYGLAKGGAGWTQIYTDYPDVSGSSEILRLAMQKISEYPLGIIIGSVKAFLAFVLPGRDSIFMPLIGMGKTWFMWVKWCFLTFLLTFGLFRLIKNWKKPFNFLLLCVFLGTILSLPISHEYKGYTASYSLFLLIPAFGLDYLIKRIMPSDNKIIHNNDLVNSYRFSKFIFFFILIALAFSVLIFLTSKVSEVNKIQCNLDELSAVVNIQHATILKIHPDEEPCNGVPDVCLTTFTKNGYRGWGEEFDHLLAFAENSQKTVYFTETNDLETGRYFYLMFDQDAFTKLNVSQKNHSVCLEKVKENMNLFTLENISID